MYHALVRSRLLSVFADINRGNAQPMLTALADEFRYRFHGEHALGGERRSREAMRRWWDRVFRLLPHARFVVTDALVTGWPWHTRIALRLRIRGDLPGGEPYENTMMQFLTMRWGRVTEIESLEDLQQLMRALDQVALAGNPEAHAAPIPDEPRGTNPG